MKILIIEDDQSISDPLSTLLEDAEHVVEHAKDGDAGLHMAVSEDYDVILLDIELPGMDGIELCRRLREEGNVLVPVIILTTRTNIEDKVKGFDAGADDYVTKPFDPDELLSRIQSQARRYRQRQRDASVLRVGDLTFNVDTLQVKRGDRRLALNPTGLRILGMLMRHSPQVVPHDKLIEHVWAGQGADNETLRAHIFSLRSEVDGEDDVKLLHTIPNKGYLVCDVDP